MSIMKGRPPLFTLQAVDIAGVALMGLAQWALRSRPLHIAVGMILVWSAGEALLLQLTS